MLTLGRALRQISLLTKAFVASPNVDWASNVKDTNTVIRDFRCYFGLTAIKAKRNQHVIQLKRTFRLPLPAPLRQHGS